MRLSRASIAAQRPRSPEHTAPNCHGTRCTASRDSAPSRQVKSSKRVEWRRIAHRCQWPSLPASLARMIYVRHPQHTATNGGRAPACTPRTRCSSRRPGIACNRDNDMLAPRRPPQRASTRRQPPRATLHDDCPLCTSERLSKGGAMPSGSLHQLDDVRGPQGVARRQPHAHQLHLLVLIIDTSGSIEPPAAWLRRSRRRSGP